ncbi:MAG: two-component system, OmpR family, sensor histidine kinase MtrB [Actinomycetota bacterium]|jgi:two-component system sensor histidine kinase MtrB|nr:histidine kinase [Glaciihabitans sp.]MDQ1544965.1 two-component system, OmpR family, sensor histidine kinase MtrB [Actinomycetota bacterium]MDQ1562932.1 two-component system, OmpR family, sensor histidine kinase MtrB [Actinomycetota bacterium]MDQ1564157.1 two-component system, OmpR family, sensor histidine kinase MtrB [Actinomycetota bacterium]MDQ1573457.1 two-component system, OmpR family, sensor histidine kinase MtrB [Actinomycetota bacterium]
MAFDWREWLRRGLRLWRSSLQVRTVAITLVLSTLAVGIIGAYVSISVGTNLFHSRTQQLLSQADRATSLVQNLFNSTSGQAGTTSTEDAAGTAYTDVLESSSNTAGTLIAILRSPGQPGPHVPNDIATQGQTPPTTQLISQALRKEVAASAGAAKSRVYWQSIEIPNATGSDPGIVIGSSVNLPNSGNYELYLIYNLSDAQQTLSSLQSTLLIGGFALILLIGAVTYVVVRLVVGPVRLAADTAEKLAAGDLERRIPERGDDVIATLARSFNGMADSLQKQIVRLATLSQVQQRFVSDVSHELRTPLTTIRLAGDVLYDQREAFPPATARTAELLRTQVQRFEILLADLLEMSRYDAGAVELETEPTNLVRLVEDAVESVASLAETKGSELRVVAPGGYFEAEVEGRRVRRILQNLLGNAIDHGEGRPIVVFVDSNESAVALAVRDYGIGMAPAAMDRVFDRFWRADPSRQRTTGGTGLGLAISLEDAALHGGWLEVWSAPGEGSCFRLTLPRERGRAIRTSPLDLPPDESTGEDDE